MNTFLQSKDYKIIEALGGPSAVARLCEVSPQSVSQWYGIDQRSGRVRCIPKTQLKFLRLLKPKIFKDLDAASKQ